MTLDKNTWSSSGEYNKGDLVLYKVRPPRKWWEKLLRRPRKPAKSWLFESQGVFHGDDGWELYDG